jgi:membrane-associated phospholipid phosphatase
VRQRVALVAAGAFVLLALLVAAGAFTWLDQYAVAHWMPWLDPRHDSPLTLRSLTLPDFGGSPARVVADLWTYPAAFVPSTLLVTACAWAARRLDWLVAFVVANVVELAGKTLLTRPALHRDGIHVTGFDDSLPSGHTIRSLVLAAAIASLWRRGRIAYVWAAGVAVALVPLGAHTPTDVAAGALVAVAAIAITASRMRGARDGGRIRTGSGSVE